MPEPVYLFLKWWKQILIVMILSLVVVGIIIFLQPRKYLSTTTALPASSYSADKASIFNENIEALYSAFGTPDELDVIVGTGQLDTIYLAVSDKFNLPDHYKTTEKGTDARNKAALMLKKNSKVTKSDYGELKVKVWDTDRTLAPALANAITDELQSMHRSLKNQANAGIVEGLKNGVLKSEKEKDSLLRTLPNEGIAFPENNNALQKAQAIESRITELERLIGEYQLMAETKTPALLIVEKARASSWPDKPKFMQVMLATAFLSFVFAFFLALLLERKKQKVS